IAGADPLRTGLTSFRFDLAAFLLPMIFFFNPELLLQDVQWVSLIWILPAAIIGVMCFAAALQGYVFSALPWWQRIALFAVAFMLVKPQLITDLIGAGILLVLGLLWWRTARREAREVKPT